MNDHIYSRFPDHVEAIQAILRQDDAFSEICAEYEELCTWLATRQRAHRPSSLQELAHTRELICNLEEEIRKALLKAGYQTPGMNEDQ